MMEGLGGGGGGYGFGGVVQRLDKMMWSKLSPYMSSCGVVRGPTPGEILKSKNSGEAISGHFAMRLSLKFT